MSNVAPSNNVQVRRLRTRTGCWNCRRRRKKCGEQRPACSACARLGEKCEWGIKLVFRPEHAEGIPASHPSMQQQAPSPRCAKHFNIIDITHEVIRDYWDDGSDTLAMASVSNAAREVLVQPPDRDTDEQTTASSLVATPDTISDLQEESTGFNDRDSIDLGDTEAVVSSPLGSQLGNDPGSATSLASYEMLHSIAAGLLHLGRPVSAPVVTHITEQETLSETALIPMELQDIAAPAQEELPQDGVFIPGSAYFQFHSALRNHTFHAARSAFPTRRGTPELSIGSGWNGAGFLNSAEMASIENLGRDYVPTAQFKDLAPQEEHELWNNWLNEIAPWLDKFDNHRHFGHVLPALAREQSHLRFSMLALSARQLERKYPERSSRSLELYQEAIHQLVPKLQTRATTVVASCVVLCVLEMMSCSPDMWRQHLDGCASLIESLNIHGLSGGLEQALFWCFARMDLCGALISDERSIIAAESWLPVPDFEINAGFFSKSFGFDMYANYSVYLCAQVQDLFSRDLGDTEYALRWEDLFTNISEWYIRRPPEMKPVLDISPTESDLSRPFSILLFSNPSAISGNQLYHTAALLMLQKRPHQTILTPGTRSILWHARRICAISISNPDHACWTNCVQPLWIAGRIMSHPAEHRAIMEIYEVIENQTGWGARWRSDDLKAFWGDLSGD